MEDSGIRAVILSQYRASLRMLRQALELCSDELWVAPGYRNPFWRIAYHSTFYTHFYVQASEAAFIPWDKHIKDSQFLSAPPWAPDNQVIIETPYRRAEVLEYLTLCCEEVDAKVPVLALDGESGFHWLPFNKLELQLYNIRHLQHHTGQLADRVRAAADVGVRWSMSG